MPYTAKQRRAACAEYGRRKSGKKPWRFKGMSMAQLKKFCTGKLERRKKK